MDSNIVEICTLKDAYPFLISVTEIIYIKPYRTGESGYLSIKFDNTDITIHFKSMEETMRCYTFLKNNILGTERETEFKERYIKN